VLKVCKAPLNFGTSQVLDDKADEAMTTAAGVGDNSNLVQLSEAEQLVLEFEAEQKLMVVVLPM